LRRWIKPGAHGEALNPSDTPSYLILRLSTALSRRYNRDYVDKLGLSTPQVRLLTLVQEEGPITFKAIAARSSMDKAQASRTLAELVAAGYVALSGPDGAATRFTAKVSASLTAKGRALYRRALPIAHRHQMEILDQLSESERRALYVLLHRLLADAEAKLEG
jgi:DNA-binding MarR family transcriptional regulator